jgi:hypothetical protein
MNKIKFSLVSFLATLLVASTAYATELLACVTTADCATGETCQVVGVAECPPCAEGSACDSCATEILACVPEEVPAPCDTATSGSSPGSEGSAAVDPDCGSGDPAGSGSGSGEVVSVDGSGSGADAGADTTTDTEADTALPETDGSGSGAADTADKSKDEAGCSVVSGTASIVGIFAMIGTLLFLRRRTH